MKRRNISMFAALTAAIGVLLLVPQVAFAGCDITDPGCYIDDFTHKQLYQFDLSIWQINRAGLVLARWLEDLRTWLTDSVFTDAFTTLTLPVKYAFWLALIVAWLIFIISFMVQSFIDLRWVDLRRAVRPILLAVFIFTFGGSLLKGTEEARLIGGTILQQAASEAVQAVDAPRVPTKDTEDMADASSSIYDSNTSCGTTARAQSAMFLNDYSARYLWSNADDVHCSDVTLLSGEFSNKYFPYGRDTSDQDADTRQQAVAAAAQGGLRQITGVFMTGGAVIEQIVQLIFAVALAMVWFGILISLVFAVFVPTEELFSSQIKALLSVLRASWLASFLIGLGLAVLRIVADSGNGLLVFICGLVLIAITVWQGKQALETMSTALSAVSAATGSAPQAIGGMIGGWATTAAMVAGVAATGGGLGAALGSVGSTMVRRAGRSVGDNPLSEAAGRVLSNRVADRLDNYTQDQRIKQDAQLNVAEAAWYERGEYSDAGTPAADADAKEQTAAAQGRAAEQQARILDRQAERARQKRNFAKAGQLRREAVKVRSGAPSSPTDDSSARQVESDINPIDMDRAIEQLHEAQDDPEIQRRVLAEMAALAQRRSQLKTMRNLALREKRFGDAKNAIHDLDGMNAGEQPTSEVRPTSSPASDGLTRPSSKMRIIRPQPQAVRDLDREIAALSEQIGRLERDEMAAPTQEARDGATAQLAGLRSRLVAAQDQRAAVRPVSPALLAEALTQAGPLEAGKPVAVARNERGLVANGHEVTDTKTIEDGSRVLVTAGGQVTLAATDGAKVLALPIGQAMRVPTQAAERPAAATGTTVPLTSDAALVQPSSGRVGESVTTATNGVPTTVVSEQAAQARTVPRPARGSNGQEARPGAVSGTSGTPTPVTSGQTTIRTADPGQQAIIASAAVAAAPVPEVVAAPAVAPQPAPVASTPTNPTLAPVAAPAPVEYAVAPIDVPIVAPISSTAPTVAVASPTEAFAPVPSTSPSTTPITPIVQPAPRASNGLALSGMAAPAATSAIAPAVPVEERRPATQPTRATTGPVLPRVAEVRERADGATLHPEMTPVVPIIPANPTKPATTTQQPWKRRKQGNE